MLCSAVSYFSTRLGSIIGADRLSFRVRDGTGRFPVAMAAVTLFFCVPVVQGGCQPVHFSVVAVAPGFPRTGLVFLVVGCGVTAWSRGCEQALCW